MIWLAYGFKIWNDELAIVECGTQRVLCLASRTRTEMREGTTSTDADEELPRHVFYPGCLLPVI
jgi:hypothetical protein